jgi:DNA-directed RNA polymerase subunit RPC12/RpoP
VADNEAMRITSKNDPQDVFDRHYALRCPHCGVHSNISAVSIPRHEYLKRFRLPEVGIAYRCDACNSPIFLKFRVEHNTGGSTIFIQPEYTEIERPQETFEYQYLPEPIAADFREALTCYSAGCLNAFGAMCRRCVQSTSADLGAEGKSRVLNQLQDLKDMAAIDDETFEILNQVIIAGHDGAHPNLPRLSEKRAGILLELMKDVLYQLYIRAAKIREAMESRKEDIQEASGANG